MSSNGEYERWVYLRVRGEFIITQSEIKIPHSGPRSPTNAPQTERSQFTYITTSTRALLYSPNPSHPTRSFNRSMG